MCANSINTELRQNCNLLIMYHFYSIFMQSLSICDNICDNLCGIKLNYIFQTNGNNKSLLPLV
jgi:hypothetical protein